LCLLVVDMLFISYPKKYSYLSYHQMSYEAEEENALPEGNLFKIIVLKEI